MQSRAARHCDLNLVWHSYLCSFPVLVNNNQEVYPDVHVHIIHYVSIVTSYIHLKLVKSVQTFFSICIMFCMLNCCKKAMDLIT